MKSWSLGVFFALLALVWAVSDNSPIGAVHAQDLAPIPEGLAIAEAQKLIKSVYKVDYAKKKPAEQVEFARTLLKTADETKNDITARYVMYREARDIAIKAGDVGLAFDASGAISRSYAVDPVEMRYATLEAAVKSTACPSGPIIEIALEAASDAVHVDDYAKAARFLKLAGARGSSPLLEARKKQIEEIHKEFEKIEADRKALQAKPYDPEAAGRVGRFLCLIKGDWDAGLPLLAKGDDEKLKAAAERDLARPAGADERVEIGDRWYDLAEKLGAIERSEAKARSLYWYQMAAAGLSGLNKARIDLRMAELNKVVANRVGRSGGTWRVIFRSSDPSIWNTDSKGKGKDHYAEPLSDIPSGVRFLRFSNTVSGKAVIMELPKELPKGGLSERFDYNGFGWNGTKLFYGNAYHVGIYDMARTTTTNGTVQIYDYMRTYMGWGFGKIYGSSERQGYAWDTETVKETVFEVAIKVTSLTTDEARLLLKRKK